MQEFSQFVERSRAMNHVVVEYIMYLFKKSTRKTELEAEADFKRLDLLLESHMDFFKSCNEEASDEEINEMRAYPFPEWLIPAVEDVVEFGDVFSPEYHKLREKKFTQEGNVNGIFESVRNFEGGITNIPVTNLIIFNAPTRITLYPICFVPKGFLLMPIGVTPLFHRVVDETSEAIVIRPESFSLDAYYGSDEISENRNILANLTMKWSTYANLQIRGGFLRLFHEVIHCWQNQFYGLASADDFGEFCRNVVAMVKIISENTILIKQGVCDKERCKNLISGAHKWLNDRGLVFNPDKNYWVCDICQECMLQISEFGQCIRVEMNDDTFTRDIIKKFEESERYAWAYGVKIILFLRNAGVDLEPQLRNLKDFKAIYEPALQTYQDGVNMNIFNPKRPLRFIKNKK